MNLYKRTLQGLLQTLSESSTQTEFNESYGSIAGMRAFVALDMDVSLWDLSDRIFVKEIYTKAQQIKESPFYMELPK